MNRDDTIAEVRDIIGRIHDLRTFQGREAPLSLTELAALRDCCRRLTDLLGPAPDAAPKGGESEP